MKNIASSLVLMLAVFCAACSVSPTQYVSKGNKLFDSAKYADAVINYQKAIQKDPNLGDAYYRLGLAQMRLAQPEDAFKYLSRAAELLPKNKDVASAFAD